MGSRLNFIRFFVFNLLGHNLDASFNAAYDGNELTISQRRGVITLIPKEDGSLLELSNWRPVLRVRFFGRIRKRICHPRSYGFFDTEETQNPKKDYFVMTRQAGATQYIYQNDTSLVMPRIQLKWNTNNL